MLFREIDGGEIHAWYHDELAEAFAPQERKPLPAILALREAGRYALMGLFDGQALAGYATIFQAPGVDLLLLDYLGVNAQRRNSGLGSDILARLRAQYPGRRVVVEAETPLPEGPPGENELRRRRIAFYARNGFAKAYEMATCGMRFQAMLTSPAPDAAGMARVMREHKALYGPERTDVKIPLGPDETPAPPYWMEGEGN